MGRFPVENIPLPLGRLPLPLVLVGWGGLYCWCARRLPRSCASLISASRRALVSTCLRYFWRPFCMVRCCLFLSLKGLTFSFISCLPFSMAFFASPVIPKLFRRYV